jgi:hypothetical protein
MGLHDSKALCLPTHYVQIFHLNFILNSSFMTNKYKNVKVKDSEIVNNVRYLLNFL